MTTSISFQAKDISPIDTSSLVDKVEVVIIDYLIEKKLTLRDLQDKLLKAYEEEQEEE